MASRLCFLHEAILAIVRQHEPDTAVVEQVFVSASARSALVLGQARGVALAALGAGGMNVVEYSATRIKKSVTGSGRAGKRQVQNMVRRLLSLDKAPATDAADALAGAICHGQAGRLGVIEQEIRSQRGTTALLLKRFAT
jgi:crossover junction endodeoxyribonuclease RuvC